MELSVSFRGKPLVVGGIDNAMVVETLKEKLSGITGIPVANQKLILKGKALRDDTDTLEAAGILVVSPSTTTEPSTSAGGATTATTAFAQQSKLMLVGSKPSEVEEILKGREISTVRNDLAGVVVPKGYKRVALSHAPGASELSPYRFQRIETLPGLPGEDTARGILESLAADPGVRAVLEKHRWTVGALCELYPEGKVGVSDVCVMGLNQNHGMKILLRLRTDDLQGFRKILSIRKVLFHELAHNDFSDHDDNFYRLMRQVEREASELDWTQQSGGRTVAGRAPRAEPAGGLEGGGGFVLVKEAFEGGSGMLGGDSSALTRIFSARELAGQAAVQRLTPEEQEVEDCCGHTRRNKGATAVATAATPAALSPSLPTAPDSTVPPGTFGKLGTTSSAEEAATAAATKDERRSAETTAVETLVSEMSVTSDDMDVGAVTADSAAAPPNMDADSSSSSHSGGPESVGLESEEAERQRDLSAAAATATAMDVADDGGETPPKPPPTTPAMAPPKFPPEPDEPPLASPAPSSQPPPLALSHRPSPLDELLAMGFSEEAAEAALSASGGSIADAAYRLIAPGVTMGSADTGARAAGEAVEAGAGGKPDGDGGGWNGGSSGGGMRLPREVRLQQAADRIGGHGDRARAVQCLDVLASVFRNIMQHPEDPKFRKVRRSNGKFKASVGAVPGGLDLLLAAGFEERGADQLELGRQDPGLIWLARSTVEAWQEQLSQQDKP